MGLLEIMVLVLSIGYIIFLIIEKQYHEKIRKSFKHVILVNGIRGKSTTTRLVDSGLRNCGFRVFSKTTGTIPMMINLITFSICYPETDRVCRKCGYIP